MIDDSLYLERNGPASRLRNSKMTFIAYLNSYNPYHFSTPKGSFPAGDYLVLVIGPLYMYSDMVIIKASLRASDLS